MTLGNTVFCLKTLNNDVFILFELYVQIMHYQTVLSQVIHAGLWGAQEVAWWQLDFKDGVQDQPTLIGGLFTLARITGVLPITAVVHMKLCTFQ